MKKLFAVALLVTSLSAFAQKQDTTKVYMKFGDKREKEQFGVMIAGKDTSFYFLRYHRLVPVTKKVIGYRLVKK